MTLVRQLVLGLLGALFAVTGFVRAHSNSEPMTASNQFFMDGPQAMLEGAIRANDTPALARALASGASVNATGKFEATPLMIAVDVQNLAAVQSLLKAGASPNARAADRNSAVTLAVKSYQAKPYGRDILVAIIQGGGDPDTRQPDNDPVLMQFILAHDPAGLRLMTSLGAHLDVLDRGGDPFITNVAMSQDWDMVWAMIELGARYDYEDGSTREPLSKCLSLRYPSPDSPLYQYKRKVWEFLREKGLPVKPMQP